MTPPGTRSNRLPACAWRGRHYDVEVEHFMLKLLDQTEGDFARIASHFGVDKSRLTGELNRSLDKLKTGNARTPAISPHVVKMMTGGVDHRVDRLQCRRGPDRFHDPRPDWER